MREKSPLTYYLGTSLGWGGDGPKAVSHLNLWKYHQKGTIPIRILKPVKGLSWKTQVDGCVMPLSSK